MQVTEAAAAAIQSMRDEVGAPPDATLRIQRSESPDGQPGLGLAFVESPPPGDETTTQSGITVAVEETLQDTLSEAVLDAQATPDGTQLVVRT